MTSCSLFFLYKYVGEQKKRKYKREKTLSSFYAIKWKSIFSILNLTPSKGESSKIAQISKSVNLISEWMSIYVEHKIYTRT